MSLLTLAFLRHHPTTLRLPGPLPLLPDRQGLHLCSGAPSRGRTHGQGPGECMVTGKKAYIFHGTFGEAGALVSGSAVAAIGPKGKSGGSSSSSATATSAAVVGT